MVSNLHASSYWCSAFQKHSQSVILSAASHREPAAPSGSFAKRNVHLRGVAVCEWLCPRPRCPLRQSNPRWQQVGKTKSHSSLTIQRLSACQRVKRRGLQTKKAPRDSGDAEKISSGKADLVCQTNMQHTWARKLKCLSPHTVVSDICTNYFGSRSSPQHMPKLMPVVI